MLGRDRIVWSVSLTCQVPTLNTITADNIRDSMCALFRVESWTIGRRLLQTGDIMWHCYFKFKEEASQPLAKSCFIDGTELVFMFNRDDLVQYCEEAWVSDGITVRHQFPDGRVGFDMGSDASILMTGSAAAILMTNSSYLNRGFGAIYTPQTELTADQIVQHFKLLGINEYLIGKHPVLGAFTQWRCYVMSRTPHPLIKYAINGKMPTLVLNKVGSAWAAFCKESGDYIMK